MKRSKHILKDLLIFTRFTISLPVVFLALSAYLIAGGQSIIGALNVSLAIFLLASGASALNQVQELEYDSKMKRTRNRPLVRGRFSKKEGIIIAFILILTGLEILYATANKLCLFTGILNLIWYNGIYTYLKRVTPYAVIPGAFTGAIPLFTGWTAVGGSLSHPLIIFTSAFIFIWQVPHFFILLIKYGNDYLNAGFPCLKNKYNDNQIKLIIAAWFIALASVSLLFVIFGLISSPIIELIVVTTGIIFTLFITSVIWKVKSDKVNSVFILINNYMVAVILLLVIDKLIN